MKLPQRLYYTNILDKGRTGTTVGAVITGLAGIVVGVIGGVEIGQELNEHFEISRPFAEFTINAVCAVAGGWMLGWGGVVTGALTGGLVGAAVHYPLERGKDLYNRIMGAGQEHTQRRM